MTPPYVVAINAVSGGGKTSLATLVHSSLPDSTVFYFDEFDATNTYPPDYYEWYVRGGNLEEFDCPGMRAAVDEEIRRATARYVVMDYPFGRDHSRFRDIIDLSIWVETPLDVAMARRILRDFMPQTGSTAQEQLDRLQEDMNHYLIKSRHVYLDDRHRNTADLVLDGWKPLDELRNEILEAIRKRS
jgi:uridine kinase